MNPSPKVITGPLHSDNKTASHWGDQGFIAYGCRQYVVVVDPVTLQVIQTVGPHRGNVTQVCWSKENYHHAFATGSTYSLHLAAADKTGSVIVWDIVSGQIRNEFTDGQTLKPVLGLDWYSGHSESHDLLMMLKAPGTLELWDAFSGAQLWKKEMGEPVLNFAIDPFDMQRIVALCEIPCVLVLTDVGVIREPSDMRYIQFQDPTASVPASGSRRRISTGSERPMTRSYSSLTKMATIATNILAGPEQMKKRLSTSDLETDVLTSCQQIVFNPAHKHIVLLLFPAEIQMLDLDVDLNIATIRIDKSSPNLVKVIPFSCVDMLLCLHDNGSASLRVRKQVNSLDKHIDTLDMSYEMRCQSDSLRLLRHCKVYNMVYQSNSEKQLALVLSDSRVIVIDVMATQFSNTQRSVYKDRPAVSLADMTGSKIIMPPGGHSRYSQDQITLRMVMSGLVSGVLSPVTMVEMVPDVARKLLALGSGVGTIQLVNVHSGQVVHEFKMFMSPVRGLTFIDSQTILTYTYPDPPMYGNRAVSCDIVILNIKSGKIASLAEGLNKKGPIIMVRVSPSRLYAVVVFKDGLMDLWNIQTRQVMRELVLEELIKPADVVWYPYSKVQLIKKKHIDNKGNEKELSKRTCVEQLFICGQIEGGCPIMRLVIEDGMVATSKSFSPEGLYEEKNQRTEPMKLAWKKKTLIMADKLGQLWIYEDRTDGRSAFRKFTDRWRVGGKVLALRFAPGVENMKFLVQYPDNVDIWEIMKEKPEFLMTSPQFPASLVDATWVGPESVVMATEESCLHILDVPSRLASSPTEAIKDDFVHVKESFMKLKNSPVSKWRLKGVFSPALMEPKLAFLLKYSLQCNIEPLNNVVSQYLNLIDSEILAYIRDKFTSVADRCYVVARLFGDVFDLRFWELVKYVCCKGSLDKTHLTDIKQQLDLSEWFTQLSQTPTQSNDLVNLGLSDLDPLNNHDNQRPTGDMDISWLDERNGNCTLITSFGEMMKNREYQEYEMSRLALQNKRRVDYRVKQVCSSRYITAGKMDSAVQILMETEPDNTEFKADCLKACLSSYTEHTGTSLSTMKLAATHLIAAGKLTDGVELLCLIGKHLDACKYLIEYGKWQEAVRLAKISLGDRECLDIICRWAEHLWKNKQKSKAVLLMLSQGQYVTTLQMLCEQKHYDTAALFLQYCQEQNLILPSKETDCVYLEFCKLLTVTEYQSAVEHYCHLAGDKGDNYLVDLTT